MCATFLFLLMVLKVVLAVNIQDISDIKKQYSKYAALTNLREAAFSNDTKLMAKSNFFYHGNKLMTNAKEKRSRQNLHQSLSFLKMFKLL